MTSDCHEISSAAHEGHFRSCAAGTPKRSRRRGNRNRDRSQGRADHDHVDLDQQLCTGTFPPNSVELGTGDLELPLVLGLWEHAPDRQLTVLILDVREVIQEALPGVVDLDLPRCRRLA